ncbi:MAG TPA: hypothetical protein VIN60_05585 [Anaerolineales bacterium]
MLKTNSRVLRLAGFAFIILTLFACRFSARATPTPASENGNPPQAVASAAPANGNQSPPTALPVTVPANAIQLQLKLIGDPRPLPAQIFGANADPFIEQLMNDPLKIQAVTQTAPAILRFPGGSLANYYDWRDGQLHLNPQPNSSSYYKFWSNLAGMIARAHPNGVHYEQYVAFAQQVGNADALIVPNLETSTVADQTAWFQTLASENITPKNIELGNEFWVAMAGEPNVMKVWPDEPTSLNVMHQYMQAIAPIVGSDAKFAVQASGASFNYQPNDPHPFTQRLIQWDNALAPADWFQAVTVHLYPDPNRIAADAGNPSRDQLFSLLMGREDQGIDRVLNNLAAKLPGKEIWVTEWSPRGGSPTNLNQPQKDLVTPDMQAHLIARTMLAMLRHPEMTKALYFELYSGNSSVFQTYVLVNGQYQPTSFAVVLQWFDQAANGSSSFQRVEDANGTPVTGLGPFSESYLPVEGGLFKSASHTTLILQNASSQTYSYDATEGGQKPTPSQVQIIVANNFDATAHTPAQITILDPNQPIVLPPLSIVRIAW